MANGRSAWTQQAACISTSNAFVAVRLRYPFQKLGVDYTAGSTWNQTLVLQPGVRYFLSSERITSANEVTNLCGG